MDVHMSNDGSKAGAVNGGKRFAGRKGFARYCVEAIRMARELLDRAKPGAFDGMALPSYSHPNPLMRWLFWRRLWHTLRFFDRQVAPGARVLDFGCGVGVLLPLLADRGYSVAGTDIELRFTPLFLKHFGLGGTTLFRPEQLDSLPPGQFDVVTALDVLEHVEDLDRTIAQLCRLLTPGGQLFISGPTENLLYKMGRWLAGFSGEYHVRDIYDIRAAATMQGQVRNWVTLYPCVSLFRLFVLSANAAPVHMAA